MGWQGTEIPSQRQVGRAPGPLDKEGGLIRGRYSQEWSREGNLQLGHLKMECSKIVAYYLERNVVHSMYSISVPFPCHLFLLISPME